MSEPKKPLRKTLEALGRIGATALRSGAAGPGGMLLGNLLGGILNVDPNDDALSEAIAKATPEQVARILEVNNQIQLAELDNEKTEMQEVTERWRADLDTGAWLPSNIRPLVLASSLAFWIGWNLLSLVAIVSFFWKRGEVNESLVGFFTAIGLQITGFLGTASVAYFGARSFDKRIK